MTFAALQAEWADLFVDALIAGGVTDLVASPGSRSTPWVLAAARRDELTKHVAIDERVAGFFALGLAKRTGAPTALLCTSGTAAAHYYPAVIEAAHSHTPLLIISADRPLELRDCAAPQTIDQTRLFGDFARAYVDLGLADVHPAALRAVRRKAVQAISAATWPTPGPVQINAPARKPLEPGAADSDLSALCARARSQPPTRSWQTAPAAPPATAIEEFAAAVSGAQRGLIACGPAPIAQANARSAVAALAEATRFPVLVEATSQLRLGADLPGACLSFDAALQSPSFRADHRPDLIIELGSPPVSSGWRLFVAEHSTCPRYVVTPFAWQDEHNGATAVVNADVGLTCDAVARAIAIGPARGSSRESWRSAFAHVDATAHRALANDLAGRTSLTEAAVARAVVGSLPNGGLLALGNSLPVRDVDSFCLEPSADLRVLCQRGAAGIDGLISSAAGAAAAHRRPAALLLGDVSFSHDLGGLAAARMAASPFAVVVVDNGGGRIFEQLPVASLPGIGPTLSRYWLTPPAIDVAAAAHTFGLPSHTADSDTELRAALKQALQHPGCTVIRAVVDPATVGDQYAQLHRATSAQSQ